MSAVQTYRTTDKFRLEVQQPWPDLANLIDNPSGGAGLAGWLIATTPMTALTSNNGLRMTAGAIGPVDHQTFRIPLPAGTDYVRAFARLHARSAPPLVGLKVQVVDPGGAVLLGAPDEAFVVGDTVDTGAVSVTGLSSVRVRLRGGDGANLGIGDYLTFGDVVLVAGSLSDVNAAAMTVERSWSDVAGSAREVTIERDELQVGTIAASLVDSDLDPATVNLIRPGRAVRALALVLTGWNTGWQLLAQGTIVSAQTVYDLKTPGIPDDKRSRITFTAVDNLSRLANVPRPEGVATIAELPYVLDGTGVPYMVNGSTASVPTSSVTVVSEVEAASAVDQVAIARDTARGYAWLNRQGVLYAWDADTIPGTIADVLDEATYSTAEIGFDTARCVNTVTVKLLTIDPDSGDTVETSHGPYVDVASVNEWGPRSAEFTVHGIDVDDVDDYAAGILADASTPAVRVNSLTLPLRTVAELDAHVLRDLYDLVTVQNARAGIDQDLRVVSVRHRITAGRDRGSNRWLVDVGFAADESVAPPQVTPSPEKPTAATLAQRLRPVGEITTMYGVAAQVWPGWLVMDGTPFNTADYPDFADWLGPLIAAGGHPAFTSGGAVGVLPNANDRVLVGAGTKAAGSTGGAFSRVLSVANLPPHTHDMTHTHPIGRGTAVGTSATSVAQGNATGAGATNTGGASPANTGNGNGTSTAVDTTPKYLAAFHIIRVK